MERIKCAFLEPSNEAVVSLRRFAYSCDGRDCPDVRRGHDADAEIDVIKWDHSEHGWGGDPAVTSEGKFPFLCPYPVTHDDPRWPTKCERCGAPFIDADQWQLNVNRLWRRQDDGKLFSIRNMPAGSMFYCDWRPDLKGPDGKCLVVVLPGGHQWFVDSRCSNCTRKDDKVHKCWVRHGQAPLVTVDKAGDTCSAGAGSVIIAGWHGFLREGYLVPC